MNVHGFCPMCNTQIPQERYLADSAVCECGWTDSSATQKARNKAEKRVIAIMVAASISMILGYAHLVNWGSYAFTIPFTTIQEMTGSLSKSGYEELAEACIGLNKWDCAKNAYMDIFRKKGDASGLASLAHLNFRLSDEAQARAVYADYVKAGGDDSTAVLQYAKLLERAGQSDLAFQMFEKSITLRPEALPVQATTSIVRLLMKEGRYEEARQRIVEFHASAGNAKGYLNTELAQLDAYFGEKKIGKGRKAARNSR